jgi:hypothetical protein
MRLQTGLGLVCELELTDTETFGLPSALAAAVTDVFYPDVF